MDDEFLLGLITAIKTQITALNGALLAFAANGGLQSYTINTGQTIQTVHRSEYSKLSLQMDELMNRLVVLEARYSGGNVTYARPHF